MIVLKIIGFIVMFIVGLGLRDYVIGKLVAIGASGLSRLMR